ncbi:hypothetical protein NC652_034767 [Populus alba x Populus x berolinensis]|nr:hypothetical protein NC652_034163 [Populus alba x Populus x berolinensis]KAJ6875142.1 hypothetical protein NC652_034767 [Populus alba x Populus x berolinensis]
MLHLLGSYVELVYNLLPMKFVLGLLVACPIVLIKPCHVWSGSCGWSDLGESQYFPAFCVRCFLMCGPWSPCQVSLGFCDWLLDMTLNRHFSVIGILNCHIQDVLFLAWSIYFLDGDLMLLTV